MNWIVIDEHYHVQGRRGYPDHLFGDASTFWTVYMWYADKFPDDFLIVRSD